MCCVVTPVAKTGLHCGALTQHPNLHEKVIVTPVAKTGLHCGNNLSPGMQQVILVTPVAKTGLHCGDKLGVITAIRVGQ